MEICRLCLELLQGNSFTKLGDSYKCIVNNVIPEVDLEITSSPVICNQCTSSIDELHKFKLLCFESQQKIKRNSNKCRDSQLTLKQILDGPDVNKMVVTDLVKARICRTCLESVESESFTILKPSNPDAYLESMLSMCLPEVDLQISQDPIMCENCLNCLQKFHQLKTTCLDVEEKLAKYKKQQGTSVESPINLHKVYEILQDPKSEKPKFDNIVDIKSETIDENCETNNKDVENEYASQDLSSALVKQEDMDIKSEEMGFNGRLCVNRLLCESKEFVKTGSKTMFRELVKVLFSSFPGNNESAEYSVTCDEGTISSCPVSLLSIFINSSDGNESNVATNNISIY